MPFQKGNNANPNGANNGRPWKDAIKRAIKRREHEDPQALEKLAERLLRKVEEGDVSAIKEFGDRLDGKVAQAIIGSLDDAPINIKHSLDAEVVALVESLGRSESGACESVSDVDEVGEAGADIT